MDWTDEVIAQLKALWSEGLSTAEIGRRMGISKNAVVGKAHRLSLPPRPSPIRRDDAAKVAAPRRVTGPTLPPLSAVAAAPAVRPAALAASAAAPEAASAVAPAITSVAAPKAAPKAAPAGQAVPAPASRPVRPVLQPVAATRQPRRAATCCWPVGEPGTREFRFCDTEAVQGRPYCSEHVQLAYVKVRDRREDAA